MPTLINPRAEAFCCEYIKVNNITKAAIAAGYSEKTASVQGSRLLRSDAVRNRIREIMEPVNNKNIAEATEVLEFLTKCMRGEMDEEVVVLESADYKTSAKIVRKQIAVKDRKGAAELLGKTHGTFTDRVEMSGELVIFNSKIDLED